MKRILLFICLVVATINASAQGVWGRKTVKGDELLGTVDHTLYIYEDRPSEDVSFRIIFLNNVEDDFNIYTMRNIFKTMSREGATNNNIFLGIVGFYDKDDNLIDKIDKFCFEVNGIGRSDTAHPNKYTLKGGNNKKNAKKVLDHIKNSDGYVRIVAEMVKGGNYDLKIPCLNNENRGEIINMNLFE